MRSNLATSLAQLDHVLLLRESNVEYGRKGYTNCQGTDSSNRRSSYKAARNDRRQEWSNYPIVHTEGNRWKGLAAFDGRGDPAGGGFDEFTTIAASRKLAVSLRVRPTPLFYNTWKKRWFKQ